MAGPQHRIELEYWAGISTVLELEACHGRYRDEMTRPQRKVLVFRGRNGEAKWLAQRSRWTAAGWRAERIVRIPPPKFPKVIELLMLMSAILIVGLILLPLLDEKYVVTLVRAHNGLKSREADGASDNHAEREAGPRRMRLKPEAGGPIRKRQIESRQRPGSESGRRSLEMRRGAGAGLALREPLSTGKSTSDAWGVTPSTGTTPSIAWIAESRFNRAERC